MVKSHLFLSNIFLTIGDVDYPREHLRQEKTQLDCPDCPGQVNVPVGRVKMVVFVFIFPFFFIFLFVHLSLQQKDRRPNLVTLTRLKCAAGKW